MPDRGAGKVDGIVSLVWSCIGRIGVGEGREGFD
jgi:hypothetical protein